MEYYRLYVTGANRHDHAHIALMHTAFALKLI